MDDEQLRASAVARMTRAPVLPLLQGVNEDAHDQEGTDLSAFEELAGIAAPEPLQTRTPQSQVLVRICSFILVTEFCERLSYYGIGGSLVLLFQSQLNYTNAQADNSYAVWSGLCYCAPLLGGWLADSYLGRFKTIGIFSGVYLLGLIVLIIGVLPRDQMDATYADASAARTLTEVLVYIGIYTMALGDGGIKPNVSTFGADQFDSRSAEGKRAMESFFNIFYAAINCGALISFTLVVSITQYGVSWIGGMDYRFSVGFSVAAIITTCGIAIFLFGRHRYTKLPPSGSVLARSLSILLQAARKGYGHWRGSRRSAFSESHRGDISIGDHANIGTVHLLPSAPPPFPSQLGSPALSWLDRAKRSHGGSFAAADVEGVKCVWRLLPFLLFLIPYWTCYTQVRTLPTPEVRWRCVTVLACFGASLCVYA